MAGGIGTDAGWERRSSLYSFLVEDWATWEAGCVGAIPKGPSGGQTKRGASGSSLRVEGLAGGEYVPDRFGQFAGDVWSAQLR